MEEQKKNLLVGLIAGGVGGIVASLTGESNSELISLGLESLVPASAMATYGVVEPLDNDRKPSPAKIVVSTCGAMASYIVARILYS